MNTLVETTKRDGAFRDLVSMLDDTGNEETIKLDFKRLFWGMWQRRVAVIVSTVIATTLGVAFALLFLHPTWEGRTTLLKKDQQDEFRVGRYGLPFRPQEYAFKTLLDTLLLPGTLEQAMKRTGIYMPSNEFASLVEVYMGKESKAFTISVLWNDPEVATELTNNLAEVFMERNRDLRRKEIEENLVSYRKRLDSANFRASIAGDELLEFKAKNEISDINMQLIVLLEKRQDVEVKVRELEGEFEAKTEQIKRLNMNIESEPKMIVQSSYFVNPMAKNLSRLEWELAQTRGRYTVDNPKVKDLLQRIDKIKTIISDGKDGQTASETLASNPLKQELVVTQYRIQGEVLSVETRLLSLKALLIELTDRISQLTQMRKEYEALASKRGAALNLHTDLRERVDSLNVLLTGSLGDFELLEVAKLPDQHNSSGRKLLVIGMTLVAFFLSIATALLIEVLNIKIRTLKDLTFLGDFNLTAEFESCQFPQVEPGAPTSPNALQFRRFANDLQIAMDQLSDKRIAFLSVEGGSGATVTAINTTIGMYHKGEQVTLVDADLRESSRGVLLQNQEIKTLPSLFSLLNTEETLAKNQEYPVSLVPAASKGQRSETSVLAIGGQRMTQVRTQLEALSHYTFYNLPPVLTEEAGFEALKQIGTAVIVVRSGQSSRKDIEQTLQRMQHHGISVIAGVITDVPRELMTTGMISPFDNICDDVRYLAKFFGSFKDKFLRLQSPV
jgi:Mrp family chromosome partitioning ATPase/capsular polysaccharide biosynthesis protein